jgi:hypothetical protein
MKESTSCTPYSSVFMTLGDAGMHDSSPYPLHIFTPWKKFVASHLNSLIEHHDVPDAKLPWKQRIYCGLVLILTSAFLFATSCPHCQCLLVSHTAQVSYLTLRQLTTSYDCTGYKYTLLVSYRGGSLFLPLGSLGSC